MSYFRQPTNPPLTFMQLNAENLFVYIDEKKAVDLSTMDEPSWQALSRASVSNKPLKKATQLARAIMDIQPDFIAMNEVGGIESLENFNQLFLNSSFNVHLLEGNSNRGIDVGFLVKKGLPFEFELISHKDRPLNFLYPHERQLLKPPRSHLFSRDCLELRVKASKKESPFLILFVVHLKSKLDPEGFDPFGKLRREAEFKSLVSIYKESQRDFPNSDRMVLGDFNGIARKDKTDEEFKTLYLETDLINVLEHLGLEGEWSTTQVQFDRSGRRSLLQFDYIFVSEKLVDLIDPDHSYVYRYRNELGIHSSLPTNFDEKLLMPSDHYPVVVRLKTKKP